MREEFDDEQFRAQVRAFIADHAPRIAARDGVRVPRDAAQEREIRRWLGRLYTAGYLGAGWPAERGGRPRHRPTRVPGITVRPIREMTGESEFSEVFLDDVRLPPESVLGTAGGGWAVISSGLASERAFVGANAVQLEMMLDDLVALAGAARLPDGSRAIDHEDVQNGLAGALARTGAAKLLGLSRA